MTVPLVKAGRWWLGHARQSSVFFFYENSEFFFFFFFNLELIGNFMFRLY